MKHTIEKLRDDVWLVNDSYNICYSDAFGCAGWYVDDPAKVFPDVKDNFLEALEQVLGTEYHREVMVPPV